MFCLDDLSNPLDDSYDCIRSMDAFDILLSSDSLLWLRHILFEGLDHLYHKVR